MKQITFFLLTSLLLLATGCSKKEASIADSMKKPETDAEIWHKLSVAVAAAEKRMQQTPPNVPTVRTEAFAGLIQPQGTPWGAACGIETLTPVPFTSGSSYINWGGYSNFTFWPNNGNYNANCYYKFRPTAYNTTSGFNARINFDLSPASILDHKADRFYSFRVYQWNNNGWQAVFWTDGKCVPPPGFPSWMLQNGRATYQVPAQYKFYWVQTYAYTAHDPVWRDLNVVLYYY